MPLGDVVCLSSADWDAPLWTNKQHLMSRLAASGVRVLYVDSLGLRRPRATTADSARMLRRLQRWHATARSVEPNVFRDSPLVLPAGGRAARALNDRLLRARMHRNFRAHRLRRPVLWTYVPSALGLYDAARYQGLVYHCVDRLASYPGVDAEAFDQAERRLLAVADVAVASSRPLAAHLREQGAKNVLYWPNPADTAAFAVAGEPRRTGRPVAGFVGALDPHKVDLELVRSVAGRLPDWDITLVGPHEPYGADLSGLPGNVHVRGGVDRQDLPGVIAGFDVGVIPYRRNGYTGSVFPMKLFEYLAAGLPVVSTPLPSLVGEVAHVEFAGGAEAFAGSLVEQLARDSAERRRERSAYARSFSWEARTAQALELLESWWTPS
jgi:glycosyltransferase involved in cell wall biosynthesis